MPTRGHVQAANRISVYDPLLNPGFPRGLWRTCPRDIALYDPSVGVTLDEPFVHYDAAATDGDYVLTQATAGAAAISAAAPGVLELDSNSTTEAQGAQIQRAKAAFVLAAGKDLWFEAKVKVVDTYDKVELFIGLSELDTTLIATSANSSANHVGWQCVTDDGVLLFSAEKAGTGATKAAATIAEDTWIKLGFWIEGLSEIHQYVDDVEVGSAHVAANIPDVALYPSFVCQSGGTNDPILHIGGYRVFQLR